MNSQSIESTALPVESVTERWAFASDNTAGVTPASWAAMQEADSGFHPSYGADAITARASDLFRELFERDCDVFFVFNGTAANSLALAALCQSYHSVICHETAHVETDECGAPEFFSNGTKLLLGSGAEGKLDGETVSRLITKRRDIHYPLPRVLSLSQPTELGTCYRPAEIAALTGLARGHGMKVHMDGARFAHAVANLGVSPAELTWKAGVDVLCFGGTKLGIGLSEAVIFFDRELAEGFDYRCKQAGQLASKMRYLTAPWARSLESGEWLAGAAHANRCAQQLHAAIRETPEVEILYPVEANSIFLRLPEPVHQTLARLGWKYYVFIGGGARLMCSWATTQEDIERFIADLTEACRAK